MRLANLMLHPFPPADRLAELGLEPVGEPIGAMDLAPGDHSTFTPDGLVILARRMIQVAADLEAEAVLVGGLTSLHYHLINLAHRRGWRVYEVLSRPTRACLACGWQGEGRMHSCPTCQAAVVQRFEFAGLRLIHPTPP